jgi:hypothetical protein
VVKDSVQALSAQVEKDRVIGENFINERYGEIS